MILVERFVIVPNPYGRDGGLIIDHECKGRRPRGSISTHCFGTCVLVEGAGELLRFRINIMFKKVIGIAAAVLMTMPMAAFAAVNFNTLNGITFNGKADLTGVNAVDAGSNIQVKFEVQSTSDSDFNGACLDWVSDFVSAKLAGGCMSFDERTQSGTYPIEISVPAPQTPGTHDFVLTLYGVDGVGQDFDQNSSNQVATWTVNDRVAVKDAGSSSTNTGGSGTPVVGSTAWLTQQLASMQLQFGCYMSGGSWNGSACVAKVTPPAPVGICAELSGYTSGLSIGSSGSKVVSLQGFLLAKDPNSIPLIRDGVAKFGYFGTQTNAAVNSYHCN